MSDLFVGFCDMSLESDIEKLKFRVSQIEGILAARRHDGERIVQNQKDLSEIAGKLQNLAELVDKLAENPSSLPGRTNLESHDSHDS